MMKQQITHLKFHSVQNNNMAKTSCEFNTSEQSTKAWFRTKGLIDTFNRILNLNEFRKQNTKWSNYARLKFGTTGNLFLETYGGKKAIPNREVFDKIERRRQEELETTKNIGEEGVSELFESNPELTANQVYEALGFEKHVEEIITQLEKDGLLEIDCKGKLKAEKGLATSFTKGGKWKLVKDLKDYPTHKEGGVDLTIGKNGVTIKNGNTQFTAKYGLVIPKN
jgi:hypothetical protein